MTRTTFDSIRVVSRAVPFLLASLQFLVPAMASARQTDAGRPPTVSSAVSLFATERARSQALSAVHAASGRCAETRVSRLGELGLSGLPVSSARNLCHRRRYAANIALADVNGDGKPDLVVANCSEVTCSSTGSVGVY